MKGWKMKQDASKRRGKRSEEDLAKSRQRQQLLQRLDAQREAEMQAAAPPPPEPGPAPETEATVTVPAEAVIEPSADGEATAQTSVQDRFTSMPDDEIREFLSKNGHRPAAKWKREALEAKAREVEEKGPA